MSNLKFKPGDRVVYLTDVDGRELTGITGTLIEIDERGIDYLGDGSKYTLWLTQPDDGGDTWYVYDCEMKLLERKPEFNDPEYEALLI